MNLNNKKYKHGRKIKNLSILSSFDRDLTTYEKTYDYSITLNNSLKNVYSISIVNVMIPNHYLDVEMLHNMESTNSLTGGLTETIAIAHNMITNDIITVNGHGFNNNQRVRYNINSGTQYINELLDGNYYYVKKIDADTFNLSRTINGSKINLTVSGAPNNDDQTLSYNLENNCPIHMPRISDLPYIMVKLEESDVISSNSNVNTISCALVVDGFLPGTNNSGTYNNTADQSLNPNNSNDSLISSIKKGYINYKPISVPKLYYQAPMATLSKFNLSFYSPNGEPLDFMKNYLNISNMIRLTTDTVNGGTQNCIRFTTDTLFSQEEYNVGNMIFFRDIDLLASGLSTSFTTFLTRKSGHFILKSVRVNTANPGVITEVASKLKNAIYISLEGTLTESTGAYSVTDDYSISTTNTTISGKIINYNMQHSISVYVETIQPDTKGYLDSIDIRAGY